MHDNLATLAHTAAVREASGEIACGCRVIRVLAAAQHPNLNRGEPCDLNCDRGQQQSRSGLGRQRGKYRQARRGEGVRRGNQPQRLPPVSASSEMSQKQRPEDRGCSNADYCLERNVEQVRERDAERQREASGCCAIESVDSEPPACNELGVRHAADPNWALQDRPPGSPEGL